MKKPDSLKKMIETSLSEFISTYILLGYDDKGNEIVCKKVESEKDIDALQTFIEKVVEEMHCEEFDESFVEEEEDERNA